MGKLKDTLLESLLFVLNSLPEEWIVMLISCFPILELRGALPVGMTVFDMSFWEAYIYSVLGNMLPVIPLLLLFQPLSTFMLRYRWYEKCYHWLYRRTMDKSRANIEKYGAIGLAIFVAVPIPTTGAWTASIAACLFNLRFSYALISIFIGVLLAGMITGIVTGLVDYSLF